MRKVRALAIGVVLLVAGYLIWWGLWYRIPAAPPKVVDKRTDANAVPYCVSFCAALADNPHGFPGHCYVVWSVGVPNDLENSESFDYLTVKYWDQIPALWREVPGRLVANAARGNTRNVDILSALVSQNDYEKTRQSRTAWRTGVFRVGVRDCVTFTDSMASLVGVRTPNRASYLFPQDYIRKLKELN
jgi:hypothetical protein